MLLSWEGQAQMKKTTIVKMRRKVEAEGMVSPTNCWGLGGNILAKEDIGVALTVESYRGKAGASVLYSIVWRGRETPTIVWFLLLLSCSLVELATK